MKKIIYILILISIFIVPPYKELNNIKIIDAIGIDNNKIYLREVIPNKNNNEIKYKYKLNEINKKDINKKLYLYKIKFIVTNNTIPKYFINKTNNIIHSNNIKDKLLNNNT